MNKDYYKILNINRNATQADIKKSFRTLSKTHHPDKGGDESTFKEMSEAYDTLGDGNKRGEYDNKLNNPFHGRQQQSRGPSMDDVFSQFFRQNQAQHQTRKGRSLNIPLKVSLEDVFFSNVKKLKYNREMKCGTCRGSGGNVHACNVCKGSGHIENMVGNAFFRQIRRDVCKQCNGAGKIVVQACNSCNGRGTLTTPNTVDFKTPSNLMTGQVYNFKGLGDDIENGHAGDLSVQVVIERHPHFKMVGTDIQYRVNIPIIKMLLGTEIEIPFFTGPLKAKIPPLSNITQNFNIKGKGMSTNAGVGDLVIEPTVIMPTVLNNEEIETLKSLDIKENFKI
tara:strand:- start:249 stop:1259 length:1011 start_codon:yes stop_codon:yes gene_type:complete